jgi:hypothetical protein
VFDPGPDKWDLDTLSLVSQLMNGFHGVNGTAAVTLTGELHAGHRSFYTFRGLTLLNLKIRITVVVEQGFSVKYFMWEFFIFDLYKVLMDTGALHSSYISRDLVDKHRDAWRGKVMHVDGKDCLGDNKTEVSVTKNVKINVLLQAPDQRRVTAIVNFCV